MCGRTDGRTEDGRRTVHSHKEIKNLLISTNDPQDSKNVWD
jgi:hypothetical protein